MDETTRAEAKDSQQLIEAGSEVLGSVTGAAIGFVMGGPGGALVGAGAGPVISHSLLHAASEFKRRYLGPRETARVGATLGFAIAKIQDNLASGAQLRDDGFFVQEIDDRSAASEICEAVLLAGQREHQEKKLRFFGNLLGNLPFHPEIDRATANQLIRLAEQCSYLQLCLLEIIGSKKAHDDYGNEEYRNFGAWGVRWYQRPTGLPPQYWSIIQETYELYTQGVLKYWYESNQAMVLPLELHPDRLLLSDWADVLRNLMELADIAPADIDQTKSLLHGPLDSLAQ